MVFLGRDGGIDSRLQGIKEQKEIIIRALNRTRKQINSICHTKNKNREDTHSEVSDQMDLSVLDKIRSAIGRDRNNWTYLSDQSNTPSLERRITDNRKLSVKKKYVTYRSISEIEEIENTARITRIDKVCSICLQKYNRRNICGILNCSHSFHMKCINRHISIIGNCPICRRDVISGIVHQ